MFSPAVRQCLTWDDSGGRIADRSRSVTRRRSRTMFGIPWWAWVVIGLFAAYRLGLLAMSKGFRLITRREFVQFVQDFDPGVEIIGVGERRLRVRSGEAPPVAVELAPLYQDAAALDPAT